MGIYWPVQEDRHEHAVRARFGQPAPDFEADVILGDADSLALATVTVRYAPKVMIERQMALPGEPIFFFSFLTRDAHRANAERDALALVISRRAFNHERPLDHFDAEEIFRTVYGTDPDYALWEEAFAVAEAHDFLVLEPWIGLADLMGGRRELNPGIDPRVISITDRTRAEMLVWYDQHEVG